MGQMIYFDMYRREEGDTMCKVLEKIHNKTAEELLKEYDVYDSLPIDLEKLVLTSGNDAAIFYRKTDSVNRKRFTIAHELAHCCHLDPATTEPHIEYRIDEDKKDEFERKMDIFAGELLIPFKKLKEVYMSLEIPASAVLAKIFNVSVSVMEARLNYLKISHYNNKGIPVTY